MPFIATAESDLSLYIMLQLEQDLGKDIIWVTGETFEQVVFNWQHNGALPNRRMRFCTTDLKMKPIFWWCYLNLFESDDDYVEMNIGYRADEPRRTFNDTFKFSYMCNNFGENQHRWKEIEWRNSRAPLRRDGIDNLIIKSYFAKHPEYVFPDESNCCHCFNKTEPVLKTQFIKEPNKMIWAKNLEKATGNRFNISRSLNEIEYMDYENIGLELPEHVTCNCTD